MRMGTPGTRRGYLFKQLALSTGQYASVYETLQEYAFKRAFRAVFQENKLLKEKRPCKRMHRRLYQSIVFKLKLVVEIPVKSHSCRVDAVDV